MSKAGIQPMGWSGWVLWTLINILAFAVGIGLSHLVNGVAGEILSFIPFGAVVGIAQWLVMRKYLSGSGWWILATALGATLGLAGSNAMQRVLVGASVYPVVGALSMAILGLGLGIAQWWILRNHLSRAGWWVLVSTAAWMIGVIITWALGLRLFEFIKIIADYAILGAIVGAATGLILWRLIKKPSMDEERKSSRARTWTMAGLSLALVIVVSVEDELRSYPDNLAPVPDLSSVPACSGIPLPDCEEDDSTCSEVVFFEPTSGPGYINYPVNGEDWDDQYRSYLRRDLRQLIQSVSARVACETDDWEYKPFEQVGLGDMSEEDGAIPGVSRGYPGHIKGTHEDGNDIDIAYFQMDSRDFWIRKTNNTEGLEGNLLGPICMHTRFGVDVYHCTEPARLLDPWRTALFIAYVAENPYTRVIGVDGQIGPVIDDALDQLAESGWIESELRDQIPLAYEPVNEGMGWFRHHHHHFHISLYIR